MYIICVTRLYYIHSYIKVFRSAAAHAFDLWRTVAGHSRAANALCLRSLLGLGARRMRVCLRRWQRVALVCVLQGRAVRDARILTWRGCVALVKVVRCWRQVVAKTVRLRRHSGKVVMKLMRAAEFWALATWRGLARDARELARKTHKALAGFLRASELCVLRVWRAHVAEHSRRRNLLTRVSARFLRKTEIVVFAGWALRIRLECHLKAKAGGHLEQKREREKERKRGRERGREREREQEGGRESGREGGREGGRKRDTRTHRKRERSSIFFFLSSTTSRQIQICLWFCVYVFVCLCVCASVR